MTFTLATLKTAIQDFTENTETSFVTNLPLFITGCEDRIFTLVDLELFRKNVTSAMTASDPFLTVPTDYLASFSLQITTSGSEGFLSQKDVNFVQQYNIDTGATGLPQYYAIFDVGNFILAPTPNADYEVEVQYLFRPASLTSGAGTGTTWLSENAELAVLYGSLVEAYIFMKGEPDIMALYNQRFNEAIVGLKMLGEAKETTQEYRVGRVVRPKQ